MAGDRGGAGRWLRYGLFGCGAVIALALTAIVVLVAVARNAARSQNMTTRIVEEPLPAAEPPTAESPPTDPVGSDGLRLPPVILEQGDEPAVGRIALDLSQVEFAAEPAAPGEPLRIEAAFDQDRYELTTDLDEEQEGPWSYEIRFRQTRDIGLFDALAQALGGTRPKVLVRLPRNVPMDLDLRVSQGGARVDLGGLWLSEASVSFAQGGGDVEFSEPLRRPAERLTLDTSMGGGSFRKLGHASPRTLRLTMDMGGGEVDLRGEWRQDCDVTLESRMGGLEVRLPDNVTIRGLPGDRRGSAGEAGEATPTLTFSVSAEMGGIEYVN